MTDDADHAAVPSLTDSRLLELRHRLKNHLQVMASLVSLQIRRARNVETVEALEDLRARLIAIGSIHVALDESEDAPVALDELLSDVLGKVGQLYDPQRRHRLSVAIEKVSLAGRRASVLAQIATELIINVYRHAFIGQQRGTIEVRLMVSEDEQAVLIITDDGSGLRPPEQGRVALGFTIVRSLAEIIGGSFEHEERGGLHVRVVFPLRAP